MTKREAAIVSAYTGYLIGDFNEIHKYIEEIMGRPVFVHELADLKLNGEIRERSKKDFCSIVVE